MAASEKTPRMNLLRQGPQLVRAKLQGKMFLVPALVTMFSLFCGFIAIVQAFRGNFEIALRYIAIAIVFDGLDGRIARRLNATSAFGREFDSLADLVAFGVAPGVLLYMWAFRDLAADFGIVVAFSLVACGATRLARFNIDLQPRSHFVGLPIPGAAAAIIAVIYFFPQALTNVYLIGLVSAYVLFVAALMVSTLPFLSLKSVKLTDARAAIHGLLLALLIALAWYHSQAVFLAVSLGYVFSAPLLYAFRLWRKPAHLPSQEAQAL